MKNLWNEKDFDRLVWKALDLTADAVSSLRCVRSLLDSLLVAVDLGPPPNRHAPRKKNRKA